MEIPYSYELLRDTSILPIWREETRQVYPHYFNLGYVATEAVVDKSQEPRTFVKMERSRLERILQC